MSAIRRPGVAVITGVGRRRSIGAGLAVGLARDGWDLALNYWRPYDDRFAMERGPANVINPGPIDTGWMTDGVRDRGIGATPAGRLGTPADTADLVRFLFSPQGAWINGQVLHSNGGFNVG